MNVAFPERRCRRLRAILRGGLGMVILTVATATLGQPRPRVVVVTAAARASSTIHLERELLALGLDVIVVETAEAPSTTRGGLEQAARDVGAIAAVRIVTTGNAAEVWVADRVTGKTVIREVVSGDPRGGAADLALGAVELLRASLLELRLPEGSRRGEVAPTAAIERLTPTPESAPSPTSPATGPTSPTASPAAATVEAAPPEDPLAVSLGLVASVGLRGAGPLLGAVGGFSGRLGHSPWGLEATVSAATGRTTSQSDVPTASADTTLGWLALSPTYGADLGRLALRVGLGLAAVHLDLRGFAAAPLTARRERAWIAAPLLRGGLGVRLAPRWRARADAWLLVAVNPVEIRFAERRAASFGDPELFGATSLELTLP